MTGDKLSMTQNEFQDKMRIIQELVPGKQVTLAHVIPSPVPILYEKMGMRTKERQMEYIL